MILNENMSRETSLRIATRINTGIARRDFYTAGGTLHVTVSVGVYSAVPKPGDTIEIYIQKADACLYEAKSNGRNRVYIGGIGKEAGNA